MANDFSGDANVRAVFNLEDGALGTDSSGNGEVLTNVSVESDQVNFRQGSACGKTSAAFRSLYRVDTDLTADFPGKNGTSNRTFSVCGWVYQPSNDFAWLAAKWGGTGFNTRSWGVAIRDDGGFFVTLLLGYAGGTSAEIVKHSGVVIGTNKWYHFGVTYDGVTRAWRIRVWDQHGRSVTESTGTAVQTITVDDARFSIFADHGGSGGLIGNLDEIVIWDRVISADEIDEVRQGIFGGANGVGAMMLGSAF